MGNCEALLAKSPPSGYLTKTVQCLLTGILTYKLRGNPCLPKWAEVPWLQPLLETDLLTVLLPDNTRQGRKKRTSEIISAKIVAHTWMRALFQRRVAGDTQNLCIIPFAGPVALVQRRFKSQHGKYNSCGKGFARMEVNKRGGHSGSRPLKPAPWNHEAQLSSQDDRAAAAPFRG